MFWACCYIYSPAPASSILTLHSPVNWRPYYYEMYPLYESNHRFIALSSPYSQSFMVCNGNLRFPDWIQSKNFDWWSPEIVGILLFQRSPLFSYPAYATPRGSSQQRSVSEGLHTLHKLYLWSSTAQVQLPSERSARVLCLLEHMQRRVCDRSSVCEERGI